MNPAITRLRISRADVLLALTILAIAVSAYWPAMHGTLLWDDAAHVTRPDLQPLSGLWRIWFDIGATQQYYPLLHSAFWIEHRLWGDRVVGYHLVNVVLHTYSACLVYVIMRRLGMAGAALAALLFAVHPVHVESVAWMSEQKNTLSMAFYLSAGLAYLEFDRSRRRRTYGVASLLFVCMLLSKTSWATLPAALLVVFWWKRGRLTRQDVVPLIPWFVLAMAAGLFTAWVEATYIGASGAAFSLTPLQRVVLAGRVIFFYAASLLWPSNLTFNYPRWTIDPRVWWQLACPVGVAILLAVSWRYRTRVRGLLAAELFFIGTLTPVLGFFNVFPFVYAYVADHFEYVASLGVIVPCAWLVTRVVDRLRTRHPRTVKAAVACALVVALGSVTRSQSATFRNVETLYAETIARNPRSWMAYENLGVLLTTQKGRLPEAVAAFRHAVAVRPDRAQAHRNLAQALAETPGRERDAIAQYRKLFAVQADKADDHLNYARLLRRVPGHEQEAFGHVQTAVRLAPRSAEAHFSLGNVFAAAGNPRAEGEWRTAIRLMPDFPEAHLNLGAWLAADPDRIDEAAAEYREALRIRPDYAEAYFNLGTLLMDRPGMELASAAALEETLRFDPGYAEAHANLGLVLSRSPERMPEAIAHLEEAGRLAPWLPEPRELLERLRAASQTAQADRLMETE